MKRKGSPPAPHRLVTEVKAAVAHRKLLGSLTSALKAERLVRLDDVKHALLRPIVARLAGREPAHITVVTVEAEIAARITVHIRAQALALPPRYSSIIPQNC